MRHADVRYADAAGRPLCSESGPLTEEGRRQAQAVGEVLSPVGLDRAVSSGLPRTVETAELVLAGRGLRAEVREALQEIRPGRVGDIVLEDLKDTFLGALSRPQTREDRFLTGES